MTSWHLLSEPNHISQTVFRLGAFNLSTLFIQYPMKRSILVSLALASTMVFASCATPSSTSDSEAPNSSAPTATAPAATAPAATAPAATAPATTEQSATAPAPAYAIFAKDGLAIAGADPVAYFTQSDYVPGSDEFTHDWEGATWRFTSAENRDLFAAQPEEYAPQYGGFCAWAVSQGYTASIDPTAWKIVDGKLYLNYSAGVQRKWSKDIPGNIAKADQNWPAVLTN